MSHPIINASGVIYDPGRDAGDCYYDPAEAERSVDFFAKALRHTKGPLARENRPFVLEPWQADVNRTLFGWRRPDGTRRYRQAYISVPRKNGKTTWSAGIANYVLYCDGEPRAENYCAGTDRDQAGLLFATAAAMIKQNPALLEESKVIESQKRVTYKGSFLRAIPANEEASHGFDVHLVIGDELHAWRGRAMYDVLITGTGARPEPLVIFITTAGYDKLSICYKEYRYAKGVRDGKIDDPHYLPVIYEADETDDWQDPEVWRKANPNYGVSLRKEYLERECKRAQQEPSYQNTFRRLHCNQWTSQEIRWLDMDRWRACKTTQYDTPNGADAYGGLDLASTVDLSAWCVVSKGPASGWRARWHFWMPEQTIDLREKRDRVPYRQWVDAGYITATPGARLNQDWIEAKIIEDSKRLNLRMVGYDKWNAEGMMARLRDTHGMTTIPISQGFAGLSFPSKELEGCVQDGTLDHGNNPMLEWMAESVDVRSDPSGNIAPCRPSKGSAEKIDGIAALVNALAVATVATDEPTSIYEERGPAFV